MDALAGAVTSGQYLRGNGTDVVMSAIQAADVPTLNQNTTGSSGSVTGNATGSTFGFNSGYGSVATVYGCRAWVNFDGTGTFSPNPSTTKIRLSGNVTSITKNSTGNYTVNFTNAMPDANYSVAGMAQRSVTDDDVIVVINGPSTTSNLAAGSVTIKTLNVGSNFHDVAVCCIEIFR
jgi:hypothetical protein